MQQVCNVNIKQVCVQLLPSVLWHCWLGGRKGIRSVKKTEWWGVGTVICLERARCRLAYGPADATVSCFSKIQLVLHFWYQLTRVVLDKGPLNGCVCVCVQLSTYTENMALPVTTRHCCSNWSISPTCLAHSSKLAAICCRLILPFWYQFIQVVLGKRPLNGCSSTVVQ